MRALAQCHLIGFRRSTETPNECRSITSKCLGARGADSRARGYVYCYLLRCFNIISSHRVSALPNDLTECAFVCYVTARYSVSSRVFFDPVRRATPLARDGLLRSRAAGGLSTGPRSAAGKVAISAANTAHGRYKTGAKGGQKKVITTVRSSG